MLHVRMHLTLVLVGPVMTRATAAGAFGIDSAMARDARGRPYLPYSLVRGKLRQSLEEIEAAGAKGLSPSNLFGPSESVNGTGQERGLLRFTDFVHPAPRLPGEPSTRIEIDDEAGAAAERMLMISETLFVAGELAEFDGTIAFIAPDAESAQSLPKKLVAGLRWISQLGAGRTVGFGRLHDVRVRELELSDLRPAIDGETPDEPMETPPLGPRAAHGVRVSPRRQSRAHRSADALYAVRVRPRGPFCFARPRRGSNVFESESTIPGSAILGAIATTWAEATTGRGTGQAVAPRPNSPWAKLEEHFSRLRFTHLHPAPDGSWRRPSAVSLALVAQEPGLQDTPTPLYDVALCSEPQLVGPSADQRRPPVFNPDWKWAIDQAARTVHGWPRVRTELRVRTAINAETLRAADEQLFSYEMVTPDGLEWLGFLDLERIPPGDREAVLDQLLALLQPGLGPLGKTKVEADIELATAGAIRPAVPSNLDPVRHHRANRNGRSVWVVTLQTPALLCQGGDLRADPDDQERSTSRLALDAGYRRAWDEMSESSLRLVRFFARQSLAGGYLTRRFRRDDLYAPFVLTDAGSTFVLRANGDDAAARVEIQKWLRHGLPIPDSIRDALGLDGDDAWKRCPYLPASGYGEIAVNPPWFHLELAGGPRVQDND